MLVNPDPLDIGTRPVCDFDGTVAVLPVAWDQLRIALCVASIDELWKEANHPGWASVTRAERDAAAGARVLGPVVDALIRASAFAILTNNDEVAVARVLDAIPELASIERVVVGRSTLGGTKRDWTHFQRGFHQCRDFLGLEGEEVVYAGDSDYELEYARRLGARAVQVDSARPEQRTTP